MVAEPATVHFCGAAGKRPGTPAGGFAMNMPNLVGLAHVGALAVLGLAVVLS